MGTVAGLVFALLIIFQISSSVSALSSNYYHQTCPKLESAVTNAVKKAMKNDKTVPAALLRMQFHDCFIRGCDASVLLASKGKNQAEKDGPPNISLHAFYVIDNAKKAVEALCPGVVSCADILALAARDAVALSGGPTWDVPKGRKDGRISKASETRQLPAPTFNISQLQQSFSQRGLSLKDLVALSGGHTLGFAHCSSFQNRIHNFNATLDVDPTLNPSFGASLRNVCPAHNKVKNAGATMDSTTTAFDNVYYKLLLQGRSLFSSDQALLSTAKTKALVSKFACSQKMFEKAFVKSMIKMSSINGGQEIRLDCKVNNPTQEQVRELKQADEQKEEEDDEELHKLLLPDVRDLPISPPSSIQTNFVSYFAPDFVKPGYDQYVYRHANGLCVIGLAPTHVAFKDEGGITAVDFNVGKSDRSGIKVTGKRKKQTVTNNREHLLQNAQHFESNTALCKVCTQNESYIVRCCVKGSLLEVNDKLIKQPDLLNSAAEREGYIAIIMPKPADWLKAKASMLGLEEYEKLREGR
ncbi:unnamed protein product [Dovyalis caffra]|uniref:peroxidase n=1 Tax=Dovyalis caffra TaxID=77055 RepID=A0AAV1S3X7_9ROSI|nr:unnamed protein product [Dovyalis caffra]